MCARWINVLRNACEWNKVFRIFYHNSVYSSQIFVIDKWFILLMWFLLLLIAVRFLLSCSQIFRPQRTNNLFQLKWDEIRHERKRPDIRYICERLGLVNEESRLFISHTISELYLARENTRQEETSFSTPSLGLAKKSCIFAFHGYSLPDVWKNVNNEDTLFSFESGTGLVQDWLGMQSSRDMKRHFLPIILYLFLSHLKMADRIR